MRVVAQIARPAAESFTLAAGLLRAHIIDGVSLDRLATDYGYIVARLRASLAAHLTACTMALGIEPPTAPAPEAAPDAPPAVPPVRIRERVPRSA